MKNYICLLLVLCCISFCFSEQFKIVIGDMEIIKEDITWDNKNINERTGIFYPNVVWSNVVIYQNISNDWVHVMGSNITKTLQLRLWENRAIVSMWRYGILQTNEFVFTPERYTLLENYVFQLSEIGQTNELVWQQFLNMSVAVDALEKQIEKYGGDPKNFEYHPEVQ